MRIDLLPDAGPRLDRWLRSRVRDRSAMGYIAECENQIAGFLLGRIEYLEAKPPILKPRRQALIDIVYVVEEFRRQGLATALANRAIERAASSGANGIETSFQVDDAAGAALWNCLGFTSTLTRTHRTIDS